MRMSVELFALQSKRVRSVLDYLGTHLDDEVSLARLADLACLSPSQLERLYRSKVGETPMVTLRRLRLKRAMAQMQQGRPSIQDLGFAAGYASAAAFNHAFVRQFGFAPSQTPILMPHAAVLPALHLEQLPARLVYQLPYQGVIAEQRSVTGLLVGSLAVAGAKCWRNWMALDRDRPLGGSALDRIDVLHFVPAAGQPQDVARLDHVSHDGGLYAVWHTLGYPRAVQLTAVVEQIRRDLGCILREDARMLLREITVSGYTAPQERRFAFYLPVARLSKRRS